MTNPNYGKKELVSNPKFAETPELPEADWYVIPDKVVVPPELVIYAVDQPVLDKVKDLPGVPRDAAVMQIHKWIEMLSGRQYVGEWSIAERIVTYRGEGIDRVHRVEVPVWEFAREMFVLQGVVDEKDRRTPKGVEVPFGNINRPSVLVDFEGGKQSYAHKNERPFDEISRTEVLVMSLLVMSPDGKLMAHNSSSDAEDKVRKERLKSWRERLDEVRKQTKPSGTGSNRPDIM
jgi:hypothetical protein